MGTHHPLRAKPVQTHDRDAPSYSHRVHEGWEVCLPDGTRCHCFTSWYDECRLFADGHAELKKKNPGRAETVHRFRWDNDGRTYRAVE